MTISLKRWWKTACPKNKTNHSKHVNQRRGLVCAGIECILESTNTFIPILICYTRGYSKKFFHHWGTNCVDLFIQTLLQWAKEEKEKHGGIQECHIFFQNLKGFDGVFIMNSCTS